MSVTAYPNMPDKDYYAHPAMSQSKLKAWVKGSEPTGRNLEVGTAVHKAVLEGREAFQARYGAPDVRDRGIPVHASGANDLVHHFEEPKLNTTAGALHKQEWEQANPGLIYLKPSEHKAAIEMAQALWSTFGKAIGKAKNKELALIGKLPKVEQTCKCKIDLITEKSVVDVKTTHHTNKADFIHQAMELGYNMQAAWYVDMYHELTGIDLDFVWLCVSSSNLETWAVKIGHGQGADMPWSDIISGRVTYRWLATVHDRLGWLPSFKWITKNPRANAAYNTILDEFQKEQADDNP